LNRVYVNTGQRLDHTRFLEGIKAGRTFATNAPLLQFTLAGKGIGSDIRLPRGAHVLEARATLKSIVPMDHLEIVANGRVVAALDLSGERTAASATRNITVQHSGWYTLRAWSDHATHPVLDFQPFGTTSPIYVTVGDEPVRSPEDAEFFLAWIDRLASDAREFRDWNTEAEKEAVLKTLEEGRAVYVERRGP
jgi:hypothetical protein